MENTRKAMFRTAETRAWNVCLLGHIRHNWFLKSCSKSDSSVPISVLFPSSHPARSSIWVCASCHCLVGWGGRGIIFWITVGRGWQVKKSSHIVPMAWRMDHLNFFSDENPKRTKWSDVPMFVSDCKSVSSSLHMLCIILSFVWGQLGSRSEVWFLLLCLGKCTWRPTPWIPHSFIFLLEIGLSLLL